MPGTQKRLLIKPSPILQVLPWTSSPTLVLQHGGNPFQSKISCYFCSLQSSQDFLGVRAAWALVSPWSADPLWAYVSKSWYLSLLRGPFFQPLCSSCFPPDSRRSALSSLPSCCIPGFYSPSQRGCALLLVSTVPFLILPTLFFRRKSEGPAHVEEIAQELNAKRLTSAGAIQKQPIPSGQHSFLSYFPHFGTCHDSGTGG